MPFIEWKDSHRIGVEQLDEDHRYLVGLANDLHGGITRSHGCGSLRAAVDELQTMLRVLDGLIDYATKHFAAEEECMLEHGYPDYLEMKKAHEQFTSMALDLRRAFDEGQALSSRKILESLKEWFEAHVVGLDAQFGEFVNERGIQLQTKRAPFVHRYEED